MAYKKKIIVCCDGTWLNSENGTQTQNHSIAEPADPMLQQPSNVTRIARCVSKRDQQGNDQITYYQSVTPSAGLQTMSRLHNDKAYKLTSRAS